MHDTGPQAPTPTRTARKMTETSRSCAPQARKNRADRSPRDGSTAIAASVSPQTRESTCTSTRAEPVHGSQQTERLSEAGRPEAAGWCSMCIEGSIPSGMAPLTYGSSVVSSLSSPKIDRAGRRTSASGLGGREDGLPMHPRARHPDLSKLEVC